MQTNSDNTSQNNVNSSPLEVSATSAASATQTISSSVETMSADGPRISLLDKDLTSMSEAELNQFVTEVRAKRTSQQLALENKPQRRKKSKDTEEDGGAEPSAAAKGKNAQILAGLLDV